MANKKRALGKGLSALLENSNTDITSGSATDGQDRVVGAVAEIPIAQIEANPFQPRTHFDEEALRELAESIKTHGVIQPVTVRKMGNDQYQLISGERRFRASDLAGLTQVPAYIRIANDQTMLEMALVENIQREDLDAIEVAISYKRLIDECSLTQEQLSEKVSKKRATVTNYLRLLKLPAEVQLAIRDRIVSMGHARALISLEGEGQQVKLLKQIIEEGLSVRQVEALVKGQRAENAAAPKSTPPPKQPNLNTSHYLARDYLRERFGTKVDLNRDKNGKGKISISFSSENDLQRILDLLGKQ